MAEEKIKLTPEIEQLTEKLLADPKSRVFAQLADAYRKNGMLDEAIETAKKGLEIHPQYAVAHLILGRCYMAKKMYALAREEFELTVKNDPQNLVGFTLLAETYERQSMYPEAVKYYQMVLDLDPANIDVAEKIESLKKYIKPILPEQPAPVWTREPEPAAAKPEPTTVEEPPRPEAEARPVEIGETVLPSEEAKEAPSMALPQEEERKELVVEPLEAVIKVQEEEAVSTAAETEKTQSTATLAELYASQGHLEQAIEAYRELIAAEPDNQAYKDRLDQLLAQAFPEESAAIQTTVEEKKIPESEAAAEAQAMELTGMFAEMEQVALKEPAVESEPATPQPTAALDLTPEKEKQPEPVSPEPKAPDLSALFSDMAPTPAEVKVEKTETPAEPILPKSEPKPETKLEPKSETKSEEPKEDAVSSFQAWLKSIQGS